MDVNKAKIRWIRGPAMYPQQIKDEIRKLNWVDRIGLYRWINEEIAGRPGIGADRSLQIREEIECMCNVSHLKTHFIESRKRESIEHTESQQGIEAPSS
jgi:hypothetical protein